MRSDNVPRSTAASTPRVSWHVAMLVVAFSLCGCDDEPGAGSRPGQITAGALREISGITRGASPGHYWVHNDSGDRAVLYGVAGTGELLATVEVVGALAIDWEDIACGPLQKDSARSLYIADTGNNFGLRHEVDLYRIPEPRMDDVEARAVLTSAPAERFRFRYDGGRHNTEALVIDPQDGAAYFFTKGKTTHVYRLSLDAPPGEVLTAEKVAELPCALTTAAALSAERRGLLLVTSHRVLEYRGGRTLTEWLQTRPSLVATVDSHLQLEAVTYDHDTTHFVCVAEGHPATLRRLPLSAP